jgi:hypothetical protein
MRWMRSQQNSRRLGNHPFDELLDKVARKAPLRRLAEACEVGQLALLLAGVPHDYGRLPTPRSMLCLAHRNCPNDATLGASGRGQPI